MQIGAYEAGSASYQDHGDAIYEDGTLAKSRLMQQKDIRQ
jgi:hypothetical protein